MVYDASYRRRAMQLWTTEREEAAQELKDSTDGITATAGRWIEQLLALGRACLNLF